MALLYLQGDRWNWSQSLFFSSFYSGLCMYETILLFFRVNKGEAILYHGTVLILWLIVKLLFHVTSLCASRICIHTKWENKVNGSMQREFEGHYCLTMQCKGNEEVTCNSFVTICFMTRGCRAKIAQQWPGTPNLDIKTVNRHRLSL